MNKLNQILKWLESQFQGIMIGIIATLSVGYLIFLLVGVALAEEAITAYKTPKNIAYPPAHMTEYFGKSNVEIHKYPLQVWHLNTPELFDKAKQAIVNEYINMGADNMKLDMGDYVLFTVNANKFAGYVSDKVQIESTYEIYPIVE